MASEVCRWGILGTAGIARKNWQAIRLAENARLTAVASRTLDRSRQFIAECQAAVPHPAVPEACGSYEELLARRDIDAVYIPLPTGLRRDWVLRAAEAGKHVLVEKPVGVSASDVKLMLEACERHGVQFMDGVMFMHSRRLDALRATLDDGVSVGRIRRIASQFSFHAPEEFLRGNIRVSSELEPHGCLGDLGWYTIRMTLWTLNYQWPSSVTARLLDAAARPDSPAKVPLEFSAELQFPDGVSASFYCSFQTENQQWINISGTKGFVTIPDFVLPFYGDEVRYRVTNSTFVVEGCQFDMEQRGHDVSVVERSNNHATAQEVNLFRTFSGLVLSGRVDRRWGEIACQTQRVMDACYESALNDGRTVTITP